MYAYGSVHMSYFTNAQPPVSTSVERLTSGLIILFFLCRSLPVEKNQYWQGSKHPQPTTV